MLIPNYSFSAEHYLPLDLRRQPSTTRSSASRFSFIELPLRKCIPSLLPSFSTNAPAILAGQSPTISYGIAFLPHHLLDPPILFSLPIYAPLQLYPPSLHGLDPFSDVTDVAVRFHFFLFSQFRICGRALPVWGLEVDNRSASTIATIGAHATRTFCF